MLLFAFRALMGTARSIDFETLPDGAVPADGLVVSSQYPAAFGVSFRLEDGTFPQIAHVGPPRTAFGGPPNHPGPHEPVASQNVRSCFLTDDGVVADPPAPLVVTYDHPIAAVSGVCPGKARAITDNGGPAWLAQDWQEHFGYPVLVAETLREPQRFRGTC